MNYVLGIKSVNLLKLTNHSQLPKIQLKWSTFLDAVKEAYKDDKNIMINQKGSIVCTQGEHPRLLKDGHRFRRFSSKISGRHCGDVERYLDEVQRIAKRHFRERVHPWNEYGYEDSTCYGWDEVYAAGLFEG